MIEDAADNWQSMKGDMVLVISKWGKQSNRDGNFQSALRWFQVISDLEPNSRDPWYYLGKVYISMGKPEDSLAALNEGLKRMEGDEVGHSNLLFQVGLIYQYYLSPTDINAALTAYERALIINEYYLIGEKVETFARQGDLYQSQGKWIEAINNFEQALTMDPNHYAAQTWLARSMWKGLGDLEGAERAYRRAIDIFPEGKSAYLGLGALLKSKGDTGGAREMYCEVIKIDPMNKPALMALGVLKTNMSSDCNQR